MHARARPTLYEQLEALPEGLAGEILSKSTESKDRDIKMPIYAKYGVAHAWLLDPRRRSLEACASNEGGWREIGRFSGSDRVSVAPFEAPVIDLSALWEGGRWVSGLRFASEIGHERTLGGSSSVPKCKIS